MKENLKYKCRNKLILLFNIYTEYRFLCWEREDFYQFCETDFDLCIDVR